MNHLLLCLLLLVPMPLLAAETRSVTPREDSEVVLSNPDMGWVLYENYPLDAREKGTSTMVTLPGESFTNLDYVAVMFAWSDVEVAEGKFDWSRVDEACDYWRKRGKGIHLRLSTEPLFGWSHVKPAGGLGIPDWLLARIPDEQKVRRADGPQFGWHVDARNPLYQEKLRTFLRAVNAHFSGERAPALVDLRGFGRWGEWHTGYPYATVDDKRAALQKVLDIWSEAFASYPLAISYSHDPDGPKELYAGPTNRLDEAATQSYEQYLHFSAFDLALQKPNITLRRDGVGGAVYSNQRKLSQQFYRELRRAPQMSEFVGGYAAARKGGPKWVQWSVDDALSLHPNYICLFGYSSHDALDFMRERPDLIAHGLRNMGYRLVPLKITFSSTIKAGEKFTIEMEWINRATGRALRDYQLLLQLVNEKERRTIAQTEAGALPTSQWLQGDKHIVRSEVVFPKIGATGEATLFFALRDTATGRIIRLPLVERNNAEFCKIGPITVGT